MQAIVLVGGEGTRLRPLTETIPKPALTLVDRPFLAYMVEWLAAHGLAGLGRRELEELRPFGHDHRRVCAGHDLERRVAEGHALEDVARVGDGVPRPHLRAFRQQP